MKRTAPWLLVAALTLAMFGTWVSAGADVDSKGAIAQLKRRVTSLEIRADRQRRQVADLRNQVGNLSSKVATLENFMGETKPRLTALENNVGTLENRVGNRTAKLDADGNYIGTVTNGQVRLVNSCPAAWGYAYWRGGQLSHESYSC